MTFFRNNKCSCLNAKKKWRVLASTKVLELMATPQHKIQKKSSRCLVWTARIKRVKSVIISFIPKPRWQGLQKRKLTCLRLWFFGLTWTNLVCNNLSAKLKTQVSARFRMQLSKFYMIRPLKNSLRQITAFPLQSKSKRKTNSSILSRS